MKHYPTLREANIARQAEWDVDSRITLEYRGNELAGEVGEACNVIKKLARERHGIRGSRATKEQLAEELADVVICADLIAMGEGIDLNAAVRDKFNATSEKVGLVTRLAKNIAPYFVCLLLLVSPVLAGEEFPGDRLTDQMRADGIEALRLGYILNGNSMVGYGSIDMSGYFKLKAPDRPPFDDADPEGGIWPKLDVPGVPKAKQTSAGADLCQRHGMHKVVTGNSWRCRK